MDPNAKSVDVNNSYLMLLEERNPEDKHNQCIIVYPSGHYHIEKLFRSNDYKHPGPAYEGDLEPASLRVLRSLLEDPKLKNLQQADLPTNVAEFAGFTRIWIPRGTGTQFLVLVYKLQTAAMLGTHIYWNDKDARLIEPLERWANDKILVKRSTWVGAASAGCKPH